MISSLHASALACFLLEDRATIVVAVHELLTLLTEQAGARRSEVADHQYDPLEVMARSTTENVLSGDENVASASELCKRLVQCIMSEYGKQLSELTADEHSACVQSISLAFDRVLERSVRASGRERSSQHVYSDGFDLRRARMFAEPAVVEDLASAQVALGRSRELWRTEVTGLAGTMLQRLVNPHSAQSQIAALSSESIRRFVDMGILVVHRDLQDRVERFHSEVVASSKGKLLEFIARNRENRASVIPKHVVTTKRNQVISTHDLESGGGSRDSDFEVILAADGDTYLIISTDGNVVGRLEVSGSSDVVGSKDVATKGPASAT
ncbi:MAG: hypothetical protein ACK5ZG_11520 [Phycisphaerae bacterium]